MEGLVMDWEPAEKVQKNDSGEYRALIGGEWMPVAKAQKSDSGEYRIMRADTGNASAYATPAHEGSTHKTVPGYTGSAAHGILRGMQDPLDAAAQLAYHALPDAVTNAVNKANNWLADNTGMVGRIPDGGVDQMLTGQENDYQAGRQANGRQGFDAARMMGNVAAMAVPSAKLPMPATFMGRLGANTAIGAGVGAMNPVYGGGGDFLGNKVSQAGMGALSGLVAFPIGEGLARMAMPKSASNPSLAMLRSEGVQPTVGQTLGGMAARIEDKAQSIPFVGDAITNARDRANQQFNVAALNRVVAPIGGRINVAGTEGVKQAGDMLSAAYDRALQGLGGVTMDAQARAELATVQQMANSLPAQTKRQYQTILQNFVTGRMTPQGGMNAQTFKIIDSDIGKRAAAYRSSSVASERELGDALTETQRILRDSVARQDPNYAQQLEAANAGWAQLVRVENASNAAANFGGEFKPSQLMSAVKQGDRQVHVRGRGAARGDALMQDLALAGQDVLPSRTANSGTVDRALLLGTGGAAVADPFITGSLLLGGAAAYTTPAQNVLRSLVSDRPQFANALANIIRKSTPLASTAYKPNSR
jgi:hypothetical protein